jgi:hypothetical protein
MKRLQILTTVLALGAPIALAACDHIGPTPMPTGYSYHNQKYKAQPGPDAVTPYEEINAPAPLVGQTAPMASDASIAMGAAWQPAFNEILMKIESKFGKLVDPVFVMPSGHVEADAALRSVMNERGYHVSATQDSHYVIRPSIGGQSVELALMTGATALAVESAAVSVPQMAAPVAPAAPMPEEAAAMPMDSSVEVNMPEGDISAPVPLAPAPAGNQ